MYFAPAKRTAQVASALVDAMCGQVGFYHEPVEAATTFAGHTEEEARPSYVVHRLLRQINLTSLLILVAE